MCSPWKSNEFFSIFTFYESKQMSLTQDLRWSLGRSIALQLQRQTDLLLCTINCFLQWDHLPNMAVGDLAFYYTLYLWYKPWTHSTPLNITDSIGLMEIEACILNSQFSIIQLFYLKKQTNKPKKKKKNLFQNGNNDLSKLDLRNTFVVQNTFFKILFLKKCMERP